MMYPNVLNTLTERPLPWLTREHPSHIAVGILQDELLEQFAQVSHSLVQRVIVVNHGAGCVSGDLLLALIE